EVDHGIARPWILVEAEVWELHARRIVQAALVYGEDRIALQRERFFLYLDNHQRRSRPVGVGVLSPKRQIPDPVEPPILDRAEERGAVRSRFEGFAPGGGKRGGRRPGLATVTGEREPLIAGLLPIGAVVSPA